MRVPWRELFLLAAVTPGMAMAETSDVPLEVVDRNAKVAFVTPGAAAGLAVGDRVAVGGKEGRVVSASATFAAVEFDGHPPTVGSKGAARVETDRAEEVIARIRPDEPLSAFAGRWPAAVPPATRQHPKPVPLGPVSALSRNRLALRVGAAGIVPLSGPGVTRVRSEERARLHYEPLEGAPLALDADLSAQQWIASDLDQRVAASSRPPVAVRQLEVAYGSDTSARAAAGRVRYVSAFQGTLDGARVQTPELAGLSVAAFGGVVPDPFSGVPELQAARFGGEVRYDDADAALRPRLVIGGHASRFEGALDERRVDASVDLFPNLGRFGAHGELAFFDSDNPWDASTVELQALDGDVGLNLGPVDVRLAGGMRRPERSRWLATFLPPEWLCIVRADGTTTAPCIGSGAVYSASADAGVRSQYVSFDAGGSALRTDGAESHQTTGFANLRLHDLPARLRLDTGVMTSRGSLLRTAAASFAPGVELWDGRADLSVRYRPAITRYVTDTGTFIEHDLGPSLWLLPIPTLEITVDGDWITGRDLDVLFLQAGVGWRPDL